MCVCVWNRESCTTFPLYTQFAGRTPLSFAKNNVLLASKLLQRGADSSGIDQVSSFSVSHVYIIIRRTSVAVQVMGVLDGSI